MNINPNPIFGMQVHNLNLVERAEAFARRLLEDAERAGKNHPVESMVSDRAALEAFQQIAIAKAAMKWMESFAEAPAR